LWTAFRSSSPTRAGRRTSSCAGWAMPRSATVDFVVHLHGHSDCGQCMDLVREMEPRSGLDLADPANPASAGRTTPTLLILPRGNFYGGRSGHGYDVPALVLSTWVGRLEPWPAS
jgi:hypothetical protein